MDLFSKEEDKFAIEESKNYFVCLDCQYDFYENNGIIIEDEIIELKEISKNEFITIFESRVKNIEFLGNFLDFLLRDVKKFYREIATAIIDYLPDDYKFENLFYN